jgi:hypothetical protein
MYTARKRDSYYVTACNVASRKKVSPYTLIIGTEMQSGITVPESKAFFNQTSL